MENNKDNPTPLEIALIGVRDCALFVDEQNVPHIMLPGSSGIGIPISSDEVKTYIASKYFMIAPEGASSEVISKTQAVLKSKAIDRVPLALRIKYSNDINACTHPDKKTQKLEYDLLDNGSSAYISDAGAFMVRPHIPNPTFRRYSHMMPQKVLIEGKTEDCLQIIKKTKEQAKEILDEFFKKCTNIQGVWKNKDEPDPNIQLAQVWLISAFFPQISHPMLVLHGPHGSAKSFTTGLLRKIIDPSSIETMEIPKDEDRLIQRLHHHYCCFFDNVSYISHEKSDILCRAITGMGFSKRQLYTDAGDINFSFRRIIALNGINNPGEKADLMDRMLTLEIQPILDRDRKTEAALLDTFERLRPKLMVAIFSILQDTMQRIPEIEKEYLTGKLPRLADWAIWGECISRCLGYDKNTFMKNYFDIISVQSSAAIECNEIATLILDYLEAGNSIDCSAESLIKELVRFQQEVQGIKKSTIPQRANLFSRRLNEIRVNLERDGIKVEFTLTKYRRNIKITKIKEETQEAGAVTPSSSPGPQNQTNMTAAEKFEAEHIKDMEIIP